MSDLLIHNVRWVQPGIGIESGYVRVRNGKITEVGTGEPDIGEADNPVDGNANLLTPGLIDLHTHGVHENCYDKGAEDLLAAAAILPRYGVTAVVPTVVPELGKEYLIALSEMSEAIPKARGATVLGIHLEGPFVAVTGAACETCDGDVVLLDEMLHACAGRTKVMSIAPEVKNIIPVIERLVERGITPFITHTRASVEQTLKAIDCGARHATHFYDVFPVPEETDPGVRPVGTVETILGDPRATCDFICDGIHVHPMAIQAAVAAKGWQGVSLITDASFGAGLPPGDYDTPWGYPVHIEPGGAPRIAAPGHPMVGGLAGSALTMNDGIANLMEWLDIPEEQIWAMGTRNHASVIGEAGKGLLEPGADADLVLWKKQAKRFQPLRTWSAGECVYNVDQEGE
jgi:N-acetylglucosamine-6-phosphate deacetylase